MMLTAALFAAILASPAVPASAPAMGFDSDSLARLAMCQGSWLDWKDDEVRMARYIGQFDTGFKRIEAEAAFLSNAPITVLGFPLIKVYPQSVGMGVGVSVSLGAPLTKVRAEVEHAIGKPLECSNEEGTTYCGASTADSKSVTLAAAGDGTGNESLLGCMYYYEK